MRRLIARVIVVAGLAFATVTVVTPTPAAHACVQAPSGGVCPI